MLQFNRKGGDKEMADTVNIEPTPIQRNKHDVAVELTKLHCSRKVTDAVELEGLYAKYYALALYCESMSAEELQKLLSKNLLEKAGSLEPYNY
jgi:hypothetical protein